MKLILDENDRCLKDIAGNLEGGMICYLITFFFMIDGLSNFFFFDNI